MSFFRYAGGKKKLLDIIIKKLNEIKNDELNYIEPFFGGGSVGLEFISNISGDIILNDKDEHISYIWTSIIKYPCLFKYYISKFTPTVDKYYEFKKILIGKEYSIKTDIDIVKIALMKLSLHQMSYSGLGVKSGGPIGGKSQNSKYKVDCRWSPEYICKKITNYNTLFNKKRIHGNKCYNLDFIESINIIKEKSLIYLDPPYYKKGEELYQYCFSNFDHKRLSEFLKTTEHSWLLSYDNCQEIRDLYHWANIEEIDVGYSINGSTKKGELLISR